MPVEFFLEVSMSSNSINQGIFGKYRGLALSILVLVLVIIALALANIYFSDRLQRDAETSTLATKQSTLIEIITNELFVINSQYQKVLPYDDNKVELKSTMDTFDKTLRALSEGGEVDTVDAVTGTTKLVQINSIQNTEAQDIILEANEIWDGYKESIFPIFESEENTQSELRIASDYAVDNNQELTKLMIQLVDILEDDGKETLNISNIIQYVGIGLSMLTFAWLIFGTFKNLRQSDEALDKAQQETTGILNTVKEGLFLLDEDLVISSQYSNEMEQIFETENIAGREFKKLIQEMLTDSESETVSEFVKLLFDPEKIESLIGSLNPLEEIKVSVKDSNDNLKTKYLSFHFYRVLRRGEIADVLVSVRDISDQILLQQQLESTKEQGEQQVEMLVSFLHAEPKLLNRFLLDTRDSLEGINEILKEPVSGKLDFKNKVDKMFVEVHRMKGEASSMQFDAFSERAHEFESDLADLKKTQKIEGMDFLPLAVRLDQLLSYTDTLSELSSRLTNRTDIGGDVGEGAASASIQELTKKWSHLPKLVKKISTETGKEVNFVMSGIAELDMTEKQKEFINDVSIQLIRNSMIHGIESSDDRKKSKKNEVGRIDLRVARLPDNSIELVVRDDGKGMDISKIKQKVIDNGIATKEVVDQWTENKVVSAAFMTGFSTADEMSIHAGRGVGLDVIRDSVKKMNGKLRLSQMSGKFCQFEVLLPE